MSFKRFGGHEDFITYGASEFHLIVHLFMMLMFFGRWETNVAIHAEEGLPTGVVLVCLLQKKKSIIQ